MPSTESAAAEKWLSSFPLSTYDRIRAWFVYAVSQGAKSPEAAVMIVERLVGRKLDWSTTLESRALCNAVLIGLRCDPAGALAFARQCLTEEPRRADE